MTTTAPIPHPVPPVYPTPYGVLYGQPWSPRPAKRSIWRRPWIYLGFALLGVVLLAGLGLAIRQTSTYTADLTRGSGDFGTADNVAVSLYYAPGGYHLVTKSPGWVVSMVAAPTSHAALSAQVTVRGDVVPAGAGFGPMVRDNEDRNGYWLVLSDTGRAALIAVDGDGPTALLAAAGAPPLDQGSTRTLLLTCTMHGGQTHLTGYVDGAKVVATTIVGQLDGIRYTGMAGRTDDVGRAEWAATRFEQRGLDDMPADVNR